MCTDRQWYILWCRDLEQDRVILTDEDAGLEWVKRKSEDTSRHKILVYSVLRGLNSKSDDLG